MAKIPVVTGLLGFLLVSPQLVAMDEPVPDMAVAIGAASGSVTGQVQNRAVGTSGVPVEGTPGRGKGSYVIDTGMSMLQRCRGGLLEVHREVQLVERRWGVGPARGQAQGLNHSTRTGHHWSS